MSSRVGRGLVRRHGWLAVRSDAGAGNADGDVHERVGLGGRYPRLSARAASAGGAPAANTPPAARRPLPARRVGRRLAPWPLGIPFAVAALVLVAGSRRVKGVRRRRRAATPDPRGRASAARADLADFMRDQGAPLPRRRPVRELGLELRRLGVASDAFAAAFSRARYGPPAGCRGGRRRGVAGAARGFSPSCAARLGTGRRIRGFLAVRSLRGAVERVAAR